MTRAADDRLTLAAIAVIAMAVTTAAHEAVGHGAACLANGGTITRLTSVYFQCSAHATWVAGGGPLGNVVAAVLAWAALGLLSATAARLRMFFLLVMAFSAYWFAGYLLYSAIKNDGDLYFVAADLIGRPDAAARVVGGLIAIGLYVLSTVLVVRQARRFTAEDDPGRAVRLTRIAWFAATLSACLATFAYAPDRLEATHQAFLEIGAASLPLLFLRVRAPAGQVRVGPIERSWIGAGVLVLGAFIASLGVGAPA
jgi:hypothetical protein